MSLISFAIPPIVQTADNLTDFATVEKLLCDNVSLKVTPHFSTAQLSHKYGRMAYPEKGNFIDEPSLPLAGKYVRIQILESGAEEVSTIFTGRIVPQTDTPLGTRTLATGDTVPTGNNVYTAYSLDFELDRVYIDESVTLNHGTVSTLFKFNGETANVFDKNRSAAKSGGSYKFDFTGDGSTWSGLDIVEYLLVNFSSLSGFTWDFSASGQQSYLSKITQRVDPKNKTLRQILNEIISPANGYSWKTVIEDNLPKIKVFSIVDEDITDDAEIIIPANPSTVQLDELIEFSRSVTPVQISQVEQSAYDFIKVTSEPVRVMATYDITKAGAGLNRDWTDTLETSYNSAAVTARAKDEYDPIYSFFKFPPSWNKLDVNGNPVAPRVDDSDLSVTFSAANNFCFPGHVFDRKLPLLKTTDEKKKEYRSPMFFVYDDNETKYFIGNKVARTEISNTANIGLVMNDDSPGIECRTPWQHILGKNHFTGTSDLVALYDYTSCLLTASIYTDAILSYKIAGASTSGTDRTKIINIPGLHYWVGLEGTRIDADETLSAETVYRDDRDVIKKFAKLAAAWYGRVRNTVAFTTQNITYSDILGSMITEIYTGGNFTPVGTVISNIVYDFISNTVSYSTDFRDVDFARFSRRSVETSQKATAIRLAALEEHVKSLPVRGTEGPGGGASSATYNGPWKVVTNATNPTTQVDINNYTYAWLGNQIITPSNLTGITITETTFLCVRFYDNGSAMVGDTQLKSSLDSITLDKDELLYPLAKINFAASQITSIEQIHNGFITYGWKPTRIGT